MMIRKLFKAEMAHMVPGSYSERCHFIHGHSYKFEVFVSSHHPNPSQMVADFKGIKDMGFSDLFDSFDHAVMVPKKSVDPEFARGINPERHLLVPFIPTAEMIAKAAYEICQALVETGPALSGEVGARVEKVVVHETDTGYACFRRKDASSDCFPSIEFDQWVFSTGIRKDWKDKSWYPRVLTFLRETAGAVKTCSPT